MTAISSVTSTATTSTTSTRRPDPMSAVVDLLGGNRKEVFAALRSGKSLDDLAKDKGVTHKALTAAISAGMPADDPNAAARAEQIAATQGLPQAPSGTAGPATPGGAGAHHRGGHGQAGPPPGSATGAVSGTTSTATQDRLDRLSALLGTDSSTLVRQLVDGQSLANLASAKGVTATQVTSALQRGDLFDAYA